MKRQDYQTIGIVGPMGDVGGWHQSLHSTPIAPIQIGVQGSETRQEFRLEPSIAESLDDVRYGKNTKVKNRRTTSGRGDIFLSPIFLSIFSPGFLTGSWVAPSASTIATETALKRTRQKRFQLLPKNEAI